MYKLILTFQTTIELFASSQTGPHSTVLMVHNLYLKMSTPVSVPTSFILSLFWTLLHFSSNLTTWISIFDEVSFHTYLNPKNVTNQQFCVSNPFWWFPKDNVQPKNLDYCRNLSVLLIHEMCISEFYKRILSLKDRQPTLKVMLSLGGWVDSKSDKYSRLMQNATARRE